MEFDKLSDEILMRIFDFLDVQSTMYLVCKRFYRVSQDPFLYRNFRVCNDMPLTSTVLHSYTRKYSKFIHKLILKDCFWIPSSKLISSLQVCKELKELNVTGSKLPLSGLLKVFSNNKCLTKLKWSLPSSSNSNPLTLTLLKEIQDMFSKLSSLILYFDTLNSFEKFLPVFNGKNIFVNEFGLHYLKSSLSNTYGIYIKTSSPFQLFLGDAVVTTHFLHFNLVIMDFVIQTVAKAAETCCITTLLARGNTICWKHVTSVLNNYSFEEIDLSLSVLEKEQITWLSKLTKLKHLNLSHVGKFKGNLMKAIAINCPRLTSLNLSYCEHWISKDLFGLEAISQYCLYLKELNLACLHIHSNNHEGINKLCNLISEFKHLKALSIPACGLVNNVDGGNMEKPMSTASNYRSKGISNLAVSVDGAAALNGPCVVKSKWSSHSIKYDHTEGTGLSIIQKCCMLEELEIIDTGFHSVFSRVVIDHFACPLTAQLGDNSFAVISRLKNLKKLTLAGIAGIGAFNSLPVITSSCELLECLSIAHCGLAGHSNTLVSLKTALSFCKKLRHFRLDQPYLFLKEDILESLCSCKRIRTVAFILKNGKIVKETSYYLNLFIQCPSLVGFFIFSGEKVTDCKKIQNSICKRFAKARPALCVSVIPHNTALTEEGLRSIPHVYQSDVIQFESRVAVYGQN